MIIVQFDFGSTVQKVLRPRNLRKAVRVCNNKKNTNGTGTACLTKFSKEGAKFISKFVSTRVLNCTVHGPGLKFLTAFSAWFSGRSPGDFANLSYFLHPDICYDETLPSNLITK